MDRKTKFMELQFGEYLSHTHQRNVVFFGCFIHLLSFKNFFPFSLKFKDLWMRYVPLLFAWSMVVCFCLSLFGWLVGWSVGVCVWIVNLFEYIKKTNHYMVSTSHTQKKSSIQFSLFFMVSIFYFPYYSHYWIHSDRKKNPNGMTHTLLL